MEHVPVPHPIAPPVLGGDDEVERPLLDCGVLERTLHLIGARRVAPPKSKEPEPGTVGWYEKHPELCTDMLPDTLEVTQHESATEGNSPAVDAEICDGIVDVGDIDANDFTA